jgi:ClpX C4-type zinc finger
MAQSERRGRSRCSFCGRSEENVGKLITGQSACICDECVVLCFEVLTAEGPPSSGSGGGNQERGGVVAAQTSMDWLSALGLTRAGCPNGGGPPWRRRAVGGPRLRTPASAYVPRGAPRPASRGRACNYSLGIMLLGVRPS